MERANETKAAAKDYARAAELAPTLIPPRLRLGEILLGEYETEEAANHLEHAHKLDPNRADVRARLGQCRYQQGRNEEARRLLESALDEMPDDSLVLIHLAKLDLEEGRLDDCERRLRHLLAIDHADAGGQYTYLRLLRKQGRTAEAEEAEKRYQATQQLLIKVGILLRDKVDQWPPHPDPASEAGLGLLELGQDRLALHWLNEALKRDPRHQATHRALVGYYEKKKDEARAAHHRRQLVEAAP